MTSELDEEVVAGAEHLVPGESEARAWLLEGLARIATDLVAARAAVRRALDEATAAADAQTIALATFTLADAFHDESPATRRNLYRLTLDHAQPLVEAACLLRWGQMEVFAGDADRAIEIFARATAAFDDLGDRYGAACSIFGAAEVHRLLGRRGDALSAYHAALGSFASIGDEIGEAGCHRALAELDAGVGRVGEARRRLQTGLKRAEATGSPALASWCNGLADHERDHGCGATASDLFRRAISEYQTLGDGWGVANCMSGLAAVHAADGVVVRARAMYATAKDSYAREGDRRGVARCAERLGELERTQGDMARARPHYLEGRSVYEVLGDRDGMATCAFGLADLATWDGDHARARSGYEEVITLRTSLNDEVGVAGALRGLATSEAVAGDPRRAMQLLRDALARHERVGDETGATQCLVEMARLHWLFGESGQARTLLSARLPATDGDPRGRAACRAALAGIEARDGDPARARRIYTEALADYCGVGDQWGLDRCRRGLAELEWAYGDQRRARSMFREGLTAVRALDHPFTAASWQRGLAALEADAGEFAAAGELYRTALAGYAAGGERQGMAACKRGMALTALRAGDFDAARRWYSEARNEFEALGYRYGAALCVSGLAELARLGGDHGAARSAYEVAATSLVELGDRRGAVAAWASVVWTATSAGDVVDGIAAGERLLRLVEERLGSISAPEGRRWVSDLRRDAILPVLDLCDGAADAGDVALRAVEVARAATVAQLLRRGVGGLVDPVLQDLLREVVDAEVAAHRSDRDGAAPTSAGAAVAWSDGAVRAVAAGEQRRLKALYGRLESRLGEAFGSVFAPEGGPQVLERVRRALGPRTHVLAFVFDDRDPAVSRLARVWVAPGSEPVADSVELGRADAALVARFAHRDPTAGVSASAARYRSLGATLLPHGLAAELRAGTVDELVVVPDGPLWAFPLAALRVETGHGDAGPLVGRCSVVRIGSLAQLDGLYQRDDTPVGRGVGAYFHPGLPAGDTERRCLASRDLQDRLGGVTTFDSPAQLRRALRDGGLAALTIAAHGDLAPGLAQSLHLGEGKRLSAGMLLGVSLPPLVVLGACWSARERATAHTGEPLGLVVSALSRGADLVIGGIVGLPDAPTGAVLSALYERVAAGVAPARALAEAQYEVFERDPGAAPNVWAGLTATGRPAPRRSAP